MLSSNGLDEEGLNLLELHTCAQASFGLQDCEIINVLGATVRRHTVGVVSSMLALPFRDPYP
jgi:hypothetical protein